MPDFGTLLRDHYESIAPPIDVEAMTDRLARQRSTPHGIARLSGPKVSMAAALVVLFVVGGIALLIRMTTSADVPVVENPTSTTLAQQESLPDVVPPVIETEPASSSDVGLPFTVLDSEGDVGQGVSVFVGIDGVPHIAYMLTVPDGAFNSQIKVATCPDPACGMAGRVTTIAETLPPESGTRTIRNIATVVPPDGLPVIAWIEFDETEDGSDTALRVYKCADPSCSDGSLSEVGAAESWSQLEVALSVDGLPVLAFTAQDSIHLIVCSDAACAGPTNTSILSMPGLSAPMALAVDEFGVPVFSFGRSIPEGGSASVAVARCTDSTCSESPVMVSSGIDGFGVEGIHLDADGNPVMVVASPSQDGEGPGSLLLIGCADAQCATAPAVTAIMEMPFDGEFGSFGSLDIAPDGSVTVLYVSGGVNVITCSDPACSGGPVVVEVLPSGAYQEIDMVLGPSGNPVIGIYGSTDAGLFVCSDRTCAASQVEPLSAIPGSDWTAVIVSPRDVQFTGANPSIDVGLDDNPVIAYLGYSDDRGPEGEPVAVPKLLLCQDPACTSSETVQLDEDGSFPVLAMGAGYVPVVSYSKWVDAGAELLFAWCADTDCSTWTTDKIDVGWLASPVALALRSDGSLVAVYQDLDDYYVYIVNCAEGTCSDATPIRVDSLIDDNGTEWGQRWWMNNVAVALLPDGRPVITAAQSNGELRYVECLDAVCSQSTMTVIGDRTLDSVTAEVVVGSNGLPLIAYYDDGALSMASCRDTACSDVAFTDLGEATAAWVSSVTPSLVVAPDGLPMVAYWAPRSLMLAQCRDVECSEADVEPFAAVRTYDLVVLGDGSPALAYFVYSEGQQDSGAEHFQRPVDLWVSLCTRGACRSE
jgi:hypothetical protein